MVISNTKFLQQSKKCTTLHFWSTATSAETEILLPKAKYHWNTEQYQGSTGHGELYLDSYTNFLISGNTLLYPVSLGYCPGHEDGFLCILIVDIIMRSSLIFLCLLRASNHHYNKGTLTVQFFKCKTIHSILLCISVHQYIPLDLFITVVIIYIIAR